MESACPLLQQDLGGTAQRPPSHRVLQRSFLLGLGGVALLLVFLIPYSSAYSAQSGPKNPIQSFAVALPELEGPVTMAIFSAEGVLVRLLCHDAPIESIPAGLNGLIMSWDGKDDQGRDVPAGTYKARGLVHGPILISSLPTSDGGLRPKCLIPAEGMGIGRCGLPDIGFREVSYPFFNNRIWIRAAKDELLDTRPLLSITVEGEGAGCLLRADGIPLARFPMENPLPVTAVSLSSENVGGVVSLRVERGSSVETYGLSGLRRIVPLNAGSLEIFPDAFHLMPGAGESTP